MFQNCDHQKYRMKEKEQEQEQKQELEFVYIADNPIPSIRSVHHPENKRQREDEQMIESGIKRMRIEAKKNQDIGHMKEDERIKVILSYVYKIDSCQELYLDLSCMHAHKIVLKEYWIVLKEYWITLLLYLKSNTTIRHLSLARSNLDLKQLEDLLEVFKYNHTLESINLSENVLDTKEKIAVIAQLIRSNIASLKLLYIVECKITDERMLDVIEAIKHNHTLHGIFMDENSVTLVSFSRLIEALKVNQTLRNVSIIDSMTYFEEAKRTRQETTDITCLYQKQKIELERNMVFQKSLHSIKLVLLLIYRTKESILSLLPKRVLIYLMRFIRKD